MQQSSQNIVLPIRFDEFRNGKVDPNADRVGRSMTKTYGVGADMQSIWGA